MKKVLIITYYWPPAGGPGVQRWLKFVKYLPEFGWEPVVFIPENPSYPIVDETLESGVSDELKVIKTKIL
ncbi:MAG: glycosyl transferase family 1, partial [Flavobacterium sp.]|nr:glycosyl transferase family 1 [Flavobacterium sp.]